MVAPTAPDIISWLRSEEGTSWSQNRAGLLGNASRHGKGVFAEVKEDAPHCARFTHHISCPAGFVWCKPARDYWYHSMSCLCERCLNLDRALGV